MRRRIGCAVVVLATLFAVGLLIVWIVRGRVAQDRLYCANNLRELGQFATLHAKPPKDAAPNLVPTAIPAGTVPSPGLPPDRRLSWIAKQLPNFDQRRQDTESLARALDPSLAWDVEPNLTIARTRLVALICPGNPASEAVTQYVGAGGIGADAASLPADSPRAGCFRYDAPTPFAAVTDGLSNTILLAEVSTNLGPSWLSGGPATVRTLDVSDAAKPAIGAGGQLGGNHLSGANFAFADGSVRFLTNQADRAVLKALFTIAGGTGSPAPGE
jgi:prepilin-type processing-associated H-X9-DG protein